MNDDDKKMLEEAEKLDAEATPGPWDSLGTWGTVTLLARDTPFIARARSLLPALAKRLRWALEEIEHREATTNSQADDEEALSLASAAGFETARREAIEAIQKLPEWPIVDARARERAEVDRLKTAYPVKEGEEIGEYLERVAKISERNNYEEWGTSGPKPPSPEELLEAAKKLPPMTAEQRVEQKVSWVFGQNALASPDHLSKREVEGVVYRKAFEEALVDLRQMKETLRIIATEPRERWVVVARAQAALEAIKTKGL